MKKLLNALVVLGATFTFYSHSVLVLRNTSACDVMVKCITRAVNDNEKNKGYIYAIPNSKWQRLSADVLQEIEKIEVCRLSDIHKKYFLEGPSLLKLIDERRTSEVIVIKSTDNDLIFVWEELQSSL